MARSSTLRRTHQLPTTSNDARYQLEFRKAQSAKDTFAVDGCATSSLTWCRAQRFCGTRLPRTRSRFRWDVISRQQRSCPFFSLLSSLLPHEPLLSAWLFRLTCAVKLNESVHF